jgi:hypothetical protein
VDIKIVNYLKKLKWVFEELSENVIAFNVSAENSEFNCYVINTENDKCLTFYAVSSLIVKEKIEEINTEINQINYHLPIGGFLINPEHKIAFKNGIRYDFIDLSDKFIESFISNGIIEMDKQLPDFEKILLENETKTFLKN